MAPKSVQTAARRLARRQHWVVTRGQLLRLGFTVDEVRHRLDDGRLHRAWAGVYAVGRSELSVEGVFIAAVLACGAGAALSHESAAWLWGILKRRAAEIEVSIPAARNPRRKGIKTHRRAAFKTTRHYGIPI